MVGQNGARQRFHVTACHRHSFSQSGRTHTTCATARTEECVARGALGADPAAAAGESGRMDQEEVRHEWDMIHLCVSRKCITHISMKRETATHQSRIAIPGKTHAEPTFGPTFCLFFPYSSRKKKKKEEKGPLECHAHVWSLRHFSLTPSPCRLHDRDSSPSSPLLCVRSQGRERGRPFTASNKLHDHHVQPKQFKHVFGK